MAYTAINDPSAYFKVQLYTGDGSTQAITFNDTDTDMQPDLVWLKQRSGSAASHKLYDAVRGTTKYLASNNTGAEGTESGVTAFGSDGFTLGSAAGTNANTETYVAWCWKATGSTASNTDGTNITSTVDANTTSGFSIVSWTGDNSAVSTVGHGLGKTAEFVLIKNLADTSDWGTKQIEYATNTMNEINNNAAPSNRVGSTNGGIADLSGTTVFGFIAGSAGVPAQNGASDAMIAYVWNSVQGFSKFGKYTGNGNADGPFLFCGFKPSYVMVKGNRADNWQIMDNKRPGYNVIPNRLEASTNDAEYTNINMCDFLSNGFKIRNDDSSSNESGTDYYYIAFAEAPFVNSEGVPCNAR